MPNLMDEKTRKELKRVLGKLPGRVEILYFTQENACPACRDQQRVLEEVASHSDKIELKIFDFVRDGKMVAEYRIDKIPATVILAKKDQGIRFYGMTAGYEFQSLVETIIMVSVGKSGLSPEFEEMIRQIDTPVHIEVMTTLTCPYCPRAVHAAMQLALVNENIKADMVESAEFPQLAQRYQVTSTPKTIINETHSFVGALPADRLYLEVLKAVNPEEYKRIEQAIREAHGHRHVRKAEPENEYDVIIVGGGTAAMSAAIYTARKSLDVLLIAKDLGGQINYTALVENYLGLPNIGGKEMVEQFVMHMEQFPIAEALGVAVVKIESKDKRFTVITEDKKKYTAKSIIFCAGKQYRKLGVPGEDRFMGRGVAFCATCDAPLYKGKKVAVVGGGNSAFTSARDLLNFATEVHLIHRRDTFRADSELVKEVRSAKHVKVHTNTVVREILGEEKLTGIRLQSVNGEQREDLPVDGVFLEIGLVPNTKPVKELVNLSKNGEILTTRESKTSLPGFFAAGDATDLPEKQIIIAAGEGAKAALTAYNYLIENKLITQRAAIDAWQQ
ncbi:MAG: FAD-dependent oxidoreductase [candidate division WOR-3 bacterium]|nr:MAG: FAD-dependent oxidoreductase [candidate division WOR-3 bacterium]